jgi:hypothetical protein
MGPDDPKSAIRPENPIATLNAPACGAMRYIAPMQPSNNLALRAIAVGVKNEVLPDSDFANFEIRAHPYPL